MLFENPRAPSMRNILMYDQCDKGGNLPSLMLNAQWFAFDAGCQNGLLK